MRTMAEYTERPGYDADRLRRHLEAMRDLLSDPNARAQGVNARDAEWNRTEWFSPTAVKFGIHGAIYRVTDGEPDTFTLNMDRHWLVTILRDLLPEPRGAHALAPFTDALSQEQLVRMIDTAARRT